MNKNKLVSVSIRGMWTRGKSVYNGTHKVQEINKSVKYSWGGLKKALFNNIPQFSQFHTLNVLKDVDFRSSSESCEFVKWYVKDESGNYLLHYGRLYTDVGGNKHLVYLTSSKIYSDGKSYGSYIKNVEIENIEEYKQNIKETGLFKEYGSKKTEEGYIDQHVVYKFFRFDEIPQGYFKDCIDEAKYLKLNALIRAYLEDNLHISGIQKMFEFENYLHEKSESLEYNNKLSGSDYVNKKFNIMYRMNQNYFLKLYDNGGLDKINKGCLDNEYYKINDEQIF